jgi:hypothetical protein
LNFLTFSVSPRHVLFAAHCLQDKEQTEARLAMESFFYFGNNHDKIKEVKNYPARADVSEFIVHPDWDPKDSHYVADIAIAVLKEPLNLTDEIRHVCLNTPSDPIQNFTGRESKVYGWGFTEEKFESVTEIRHVNIQLVDQALCNSSHPELSKIMSETSFCAGGKDGRTGACNGKFLTFFY